MPKGNPKAQTGVSQAARITKMMKQFIEETEFTERQS